MHPLPHTRAHTHTCTHIHTRPRESLQLRSWPLLHLPGCNRSPGLGTRYPRKEHDPA